MNDYIAAKFEIKNLPDALFEASLPTITYLLDESAARAEIYSL